MDDATYERYKKIIIESKNYDELKEKLEVNGEKLVDILAMVLYRTFEMKGELPHSKKTVDYSTWSYEELEKECKKRGIL